MRRSTHRQAIALGLAAVLSLGAGAALAKDEDEDGVSLKADWPDGGDVELELEARNVEPSICFIWRTDALRDGDTVASRILDRNGQPVLELGHGDQVVEGSASGCEIPLTTAYREVFSRPGDHVVEVRVVAQPGTGARPVLRSERLEED